MDDEDGGVYLLRCCAALAFEPVVQGCCYDERGYCEEEAEDDSDCFAKRAGVARVAPKVVEVEDGEYGGDGECEPWRMEEAAPGSWVVGRVSYVGNAVTGGAVDEHETRGDVEGPSQEEERQCDECQESAMDGVGEADEGAVVKTDSGGYQEGDEECDEDLYAEQVEDLQGFAKDGESLLNKSLHGTASLAR